MSRSTEVRLIEGTGSPSGRYAVAWGIPGIADLNRFQIQTPPYLPRDRIRNFLVEKRGLRILSMIPLHTRDLPLGPAVNFLNPDGKKAHFRYKEGGNDYQFKGNGRNHSEMTTHWDCAEEWGIVLHDGKWWFNAIYLCHRHGSGFAIKEIGNGVEDFLRAYVRKRHRALYDAVHRHDPRDPTVTVDEVKLHSPFLTLRVCAHVIKKDTPLDTYGDLRLRIQGCAGDLTVIPVDFRPLPLEVMRDRYSINNG